MGSVIVMQSGRTVWEEQSRVEPRAGSPLSETGLKAVEEAVAALPAEGIAAVYSGKGDPERRTARITARKFNLRVRTREALAELDYGLWEGLTLEEIERRHPRVYKQWIEEPATVRPPEGETLAEAQGRLCAAVREILRKHAQGPALIVLRPLAAGLVRCALENEGLSGFWRFVDREFTWRRYEFQNKGADALTPGR